MIHIVDQFVKTLSAALAVRRSYFSDHPQVREAISRLQKSSNDMRGEGERFTLAFAGDVCVWKGRSVWVEPTTALRVYEALKAVGAGGIIFESGYNETDFRALVESLVANSDFLIKGETSQEQRRDAREKAGVHMKQIGSTHLKLTQEMKADTNLEAETEFTGIILEESKLKDLVIPRKVFQESVGSVRSLLEDVREGKSVDLARAQYMIEKIDEALLKPDSGLSHLASVRDYDQFTYNHSVNVCIMAMAWARAMSLGTQTIRDVGIAAFLHDTGKMVIPSSVLEKAEGLSADEWRILRQHAPLGAEILIDSPGIPHVAISTAFGHHIHYNHSGYPRVSDRYTLSPITQIVTIVDVYEAITAKRPYKKGIPPERAVSHLLRWAGEKFHAELVRSFITYIGVYPLGTLVKLASGKVGLVVEGNEHDPIRPKLRIVVEEGDAQLERPYILDLELVSKERIMGSLDWNRKFLAHMSGL